MTTQPNATQHATLISQANMAPAQLLQNLDSNFVGLTSTAVLTHRRTYGSNDIATEHVTPLWKRIFDTFKNPLNLLLVLLAIISYATGDIRAAIIVSGMIVLSIVLRFTQEVRADAAAAKLKALIAHRATVIRDGNNQDVLFNELVVGDIVQLSAGAMIPADLRILSAKNLSLDQSTLTGEALPVTKTSDLPDLSISEPLDHPALCFLGSNVVSGSGSAVVIATGANTFFGELAARVTAAREQTSFDRGVNSFTWLMIRFICVMVPLVFLINGLVTRNWWEAFLFATSIAVGLTPEMMPMIVSVNLSKGAIAMSRKQVIVKRLNAIQNFGAMDVLFTDKTGTLTDGKIALANHVDVHSHESPQVLHYAYLNSYFHTGLNNALDDAIIAHANTDGIRNDDVTLQKIDEIPFDFQRKRMSVIVGDTNQQILICKGAFEEILACCSQIAVSTGVTALTATLRENVTAQVGDFNRHGFREVAVAYKPVAGTAFGVADENDLILLGFLSFLDPPKASAKSAVAELANLAVQIKILTGDSDIITAHICEQVGIATTHILLGHQIAQMDDVALTQATEICHVFAKLSPDQKERIIKCMQKNGHVVGFMGDGINDAPALRAADVGISVDSAVDIAKESSDIILLDQNLLVLNDGVIEGRKVFGNIIKYVRMAASSNFGNMFSILGVSAFLPFVPMLPIQILLNNLLYDISQSTIPTDTVDPEWLQKPRRWEIGNLQRFILAIGPISSLFDYTTFFLLLYFFGARTNPQFFHTAWFIESIFSQTLVIHVIRTNKIPFLQSMASWQLTLSSSLILVVASWLTLSSYGALFGFVPLPLNYWLALFGMMLIYIPLTQFVKSWYVRRYGV